MVITVSVCTVNEGLTTGIQTQGLGGGGGPRVSGSLGVPGSQGLRVSGFLAPVL